MSNETVSNEKKLEIMAAMKKAGRRERIVMAIQVGIVVGAVGWVRMDCRARADDLRAQCIEAGGDPVGCLEASP